MARLPRLSLAGYVHHVVQRGNNRQPIFLGMADFSFFLALLRDNARKYLVDVHAYVLMDNHFHLLLTPRTDDGVPLMMQAVGRSYVRYFNDTHHRTGTLWEGRYKSTLVQAEAYLLACMAYIDLNPVRANVVAQVRDYAWSSHAHYIGQRLDALITPHPLVWALGNTPFAREAAYAQYVQGGASAAQQAALTEGVLRGWAVGDAVFLEDLQKKTPRRVLKGRPGRPANAVTTN